MMTKEEIRQRADEAYTARRTNAYLYACAVEKEDKKEAEFRYRLFVAYGMVHDALEGVLT